MREDSHLQGDDAPLPAPARGAIFRSVADGGVLFSTETEIYFGVNAIGARIWELLPPANATVGDICATLVEVYPDASEAQIRTDVRNFLRELIENGLAITASPNVARTTPV